MELADILAWKSAAMALLSTDGRWLAYRISPLDGDSEVVVRQTQGDKEYRFPVGDARGTPGALAISDDAKWVAFSVAPTKKEAAQLRKQRKPLQNKVDDPEPGRRIDDDDREDPALRLLGREGDVDRAEEVRARRAGRRRSRRAGGPPAPGGAAAASSAADDRPKGSDLILHELTTGAELNVGNVNEFAFDKSGRFLALTIDAADKLGNGVVLHDMQTGAVSPLDTGKASLRATGVDREGRRARRAEGHRGQALQGQGLRGRRASRSSARRSPRRSSTTRPPTRRSPRGCRSARTATPSWTEDLSAIFFGIRTLKKSDAKPDAKADAEGGRAGGEAARRRRPPPTPTPDEEKPNLMIWHYKDPRLQSQQQVQEAADKNFSYASIYRVAEKKFIRLADDALRSVSTPLQGQYAIGTDVREYELSGNLDGRNYQDVYVVNLKTGERKLALKKARWVNQASTDGTKFLYYEDGHFFVYDMASGQSANITKTVPTSFINTEDDHNVVKPPRPALGWTKDGDAVLLSDGWDIWKVPATGGHRHEPDRERQEGRDPLPALCCGLDPEERGWDLSVPRYVNMFGEFTKKGGFGRLEPGKPGVQPLLWDDAAFGMQKAKKADVYLYTKSTPYAPRRLLRDRRVAEDREEDHRARRPGEELPVVERRADRRLHRARSARAARR